MTNIDRRTSTTVGVVATGRTWGHHSHLVLRNSMIPSWTIKEVIQRDDRIYSFTNTTAHGRTITTSFRTGLVSVRLLLSRSLVVSERLLIIFSNPSTKVPIDSSAASKLRSDTFDRYVSVKTFCEQSTDKVFLRYPPR